MSNKIGVMLQKGSQRFSWIGGKSLEILSNYFQTQILIALVIFVDAFWNKIREIEIIEIFQYFLKYCSQFRDAQLQTLVDVLILKVWNELMRQFTNSVTSSKPETKKKLFQPRIECMNMISLEHLCFQCTTWDIWYFAFHSHRH